MKEISWAPPKKVDWTYHITDKELELTEYYGSKPYTEEVSTLNLETGAANFGDTARMLLELDEEETLDARQLAPAYFLKKAITSDELLVQELLEEHGYSYDVVDQEDGYRAELSDLEVHVSLPVSWRGTEDGQ